jgi:hypothetical protein
MPDVGFTIIPSSPLLCLLNLFYQSDVHYLRAQVISRIDHRNSTLQRLMPARNILYFPIPGSSVTISGCNSICIALRSVLSSIDDAVVEEYKIGQEQVQATIDQYGLPPGFLFRASCDSWSRSARRKRGRRDNAATTAEFPLPINQDQLEAMSDFFATAALVCIVRFTGEFDREDQRELKQLGLEFQWVYGCDRALFESFVNHVRRAVMLGE